ncbi:hypothetical protein [Streptomyces flaveolus]
MTSAGTSPSSRSGALTPEQLRTPGGFRIAALTDPAGNVITLAQDVDPNL